jgi:hypothetical protein
MIAWRFIEFAWSSDGLPLNQTSQPSPDTDDDWDAKATEALEAARLMPAGKEKSEAMKRAGLLRKAADIHKPFPAKRRGRPPKHT